MAAAAEQENPQIDKSDGQNNQFKNNLIGMMLLTFSMAVQLGSFALFKYATNTVKISLLEGLAIVNFVQWVIAGILWYLPPSITKIPKFNKSWYGESEYRIYMWIRGFLYWLDFYVYYTGISLISLGDAEAIYFLGPIFMAFGARIFLKEKFSKYFIFTFALTVIGLVIICKPILHTSVNYSLIYLLIGCIAYAVNKVLIHGKLQKAHWIQLTITATFQTWVLWTPLLILINNYTNINLDNNGSWMFSFDKFCLLSGVGICTMLGVITSVISYQIAETTKVSWIEYTNVPFGYFYQYILNGVYPTMWNIIGAVIVLSTCIISFIEQYFEYKKNSTTKKEELLQSNIN